MGRLAPARGMAAPLRAPAVAVLLLVALCVGSCQTPRQPSGTLHQVRAGETIYGIARRYGVPPEAILAANDIPDVRAIPVGTRLWIPGTGEPALRGAAARRPPLPEAERRQRAQREALAAANLRFAWPLHGELTSGFGPRGRGMHEGIDLAVRPGTPIRAAEAGRVIYAGRLGAYGKTVVLRHEGHYATVYAHNRRNRVSRGARVARGAVLAEVGATGNATGPHLHFEIRRGEQAQDPLLYLP